MKGGPVTSKLPNTRVLKTDLHALFYKLTGFKAHDFQIDIACRLLRGENYAPRAAWKTVEKVGDLNQTFYLCLPPDLASYDPDEGLALGRPGSHIFEQSAQEVVYEPYSYRKETWHDHIRRVMEQYDKQEPYHSVGAARLAKDLGIEEEAIEYMGLLVAALHDLGKLSAEWQNKMWLWQQSVKPDEPRDCFLGHSDFDGMDMEQRKRIRARGDTAGALLHISFR